MISLLSNMNHGEERSLVGSRRTDLHRKNIDPSFRMRMTWGIRNGIDDGDTVTEPSGKLDSGRSSVYHSRPQIANGIAGSLRISSKVCSHCGTSKTPLWRSGPRGPKSLCNACGIRLKKVGRRNAKNDLRAASLPSLVMSSKSSNYTIARDDHLRHVSKKSRLSVTKTGVEDQSSEMQNLGDNTSPQYVIPHYTRHDATHELAQIRSSLAKFHQKKKLARGIGVPNAAARDEEEGAIMLMALSYGYVNA